MPDVEKSGGLTCEGTPQELWETGMKFYSGDGAQHDYVQAARYFLRAAEQGHMEAQYRLGLCFGKG